MANPRIYSSKKIGCCYNTRQSTKEFQKLLRNKNFGINLNIGHLNLASKALNFNRYKFVKQIQNKIFAIEVSHNFRKIDNHLPLKKKKGLVLEKY